MPDSNYVQKDTCSAHVVEFIEKLGAFSEKLNAMDLKREQAKGEAKELRDETNKKLDEFWSALVDFRKRVLGNGHLEGTLAYDVKVIKDDLEQMKLDRVSEKESAAGEKKAEMEAKEKQKDRSWEMKLLLVGNFFMIGLAIVDKFS